MVHVKRVELTNFKSFSGTTSIPLLPGFTVVSGPNGSGKSNILDALLFCLGLSSSKGMRAERLPDLVNHGHGESNRKTKEASVTTVLDLSDFNGSLVDAEESELDTTEGIDPTADDSTNGKTHQRTIPKEFSITRRLRVTPAGTYTSTYYMNGEACTLTELHETLNRLRIYPEGYNVVLQGDVTSIISMNPKQRREIIDELAGVAQFDRKIDLAKEKLEDVREKIESSRIIERELVTQRDRLSQDRTKAEKYQKLRQELHEKEQWEAIIQWRTLEQQIWTLREEVENGDRNLTQLSEQLIQLSQTITQTTTELDHLNTRVKRLGEDQLISLQSTLANQQAEQRQLQQQHHTLQTRQIHLQATIAKTEQEITTTQHTLEQLGVNRHQAEANLSLLQTVRDETAATVTQKREEASTLADASQAWVQQQTQLNHQIETLLQTLDPQRTEQAQLQERQTRLSGQINEYTQLIAKLESELTAKQEPLNQLLTQQQQTSVPELSQTLVSLEVELQTQQETQKRLLAEQREKQRQLDKLEAQAQAQQESLGTYASKMILQSGLSGVCGLVAQLGKVDPRYQLAVEIAAGARLGQLVVENDQIAAQGIELLKQKRAGRCTFLPLNKIKPGRNNFPESLRWAMGFIDYAVNLIECEPRYQDIFAYVFGNTAVFNSLEDARRHLGHCRMVTLEGELLEASGAMTGGSSVERSSLRFGIAAPTESAQQTALKQRLSEIEAILLRCEGEINILSAAVKQRSGELAEAKTRQREQQLLLEQQQKEIQAIATSLEKTQTQLTQAQNENTTTQTRLATLNQDLPALESQLGQYRQTLAELEQSQTPSQWQELQVVIREQENLLQDREQALRGASQKLQELDNQRDRLLEKLQQLQQRLQEDQDQVVSTHRHQDTLRAQQSQLQAQISQTQGQLAVLEEALSAEKQERDRTETELRQLYLNQQNLQFTQEKLQETQTTRRQTLETLTTQLQEQSELPNPLPEIPPNLDLETLQKEVRSLQKRLSALEPVNMLAIEEYDRTNERLTELVDKLTILENERTEILLRIENFTTLRRRAFTEAFDAVNRNFQTIFAELSDGDGNLQLDDPEDPFNGGLNLIAHPKGKPVQRLASMSGGEKSLTALSFIFSLQRYRPSPFYAFDEVDMFLDGANVERLSKMIKQQATQAQFIVVSLRRPMIESSECTIGVTQAKGAYTQVLGIKLSSQHTA